MLLIKNNDQLNQEEKETAISERTATEAAGGESKLNYSLMSILRGRWSDSLRAKRDIEIQFFKNKDQADGTYEPKKFAAIKENGGSDVFIGITETKNRHAKAWIRDALFQPGQHCWNVEPTPSPEVPPALMEAVQRKFVSQTMNEINTQSTATGVQPDMGMAIQTIQNQLPELQNAIKSEMKSIVWEKSRDMAMEVDDILTEGGWYEALDESIPDIVECGTGVILGPFKRKIPILVPGKEGVAVEERVVQQFDRVSPFDVYPQADSTGPQDGWVFVKLSYRKLDLQKLIGVPGFADDEIKAILEEAGSGKLREWTQIEVERALREKKTTDANAVYDTDRIDCLLYMGPLSGQALIDAGMEIPDDKKSFDFNAMVWFVGNHYLKAVINEDPLGRKPISAGHFEENTDGWWGKGLAQMIEAEQQVCNACARAIVNNVAMGSGPQVEINIDRLNGGASGDTRIIPWKKWLTTNRQMQTGPAISFWQAGMHAQEIMGVFDSFRKGADERSNIPAYAHGDSQVGGAGNTASGLSMLISQASRGIRGIIKSIDRNLIIPSVTFVYELLSLDPKYQDKIGDVRLVAKGSQALLEKEQRTVRMLEFLNATNNPLDQEIMGAEGRGYLLGEVARSYEIDPERAFPRLAALRGKVLGKPTAGIVPPGPPGAAVPPGEEQPIPNRGTPPVASRNLAPGGVEPQGGAAQLLAGRGGPPAEPENPVGGV